jgi:hypothetical protein
MTTIESWFIPFNILTIICTGLSIIIALIFIIIIIVDKTCHTISMMLIVNSCLSELIFGSVLLWMSIFTTQNDFKQIAYEDSYCIFRGYLKYVGYALQNYSYLLQALYRYITVVYPTCLVYQSIRIQTLVIVIIIILSIIYPIPFVINNQIKYIIDDQICQMPLQLSFLVIYNAFYVYGIPVSSIIFIYFKLVRYVKEMNKRITPENTLIRAERELKMVGRIVTIIILLITIGFPYSIFLLMSFFNSAPKYHLRIAFIFADVLLPSIMFAIFQFTDPLRTSIMKLIHVRT